MVQWIQCFLPKLLLNHRDSLSSLHFSRVSLASDRFVSFGARPIKGEEEGERCIFETSLLRNCAIGGANLRNQGPNHFEVFLIAVGEIVLVLPILMWAAQKFSLIDELVSEILRELFEQIGKFGVNKVLDRLLDSIKFHVPRSELSICRSIILSEVAEDVTL